VPPRSILYCRTRIKTQFFPYLFTYANVDIRWPESLEKHGDFWGKYLKNEVGGGDENVNPVEKTLFVTNLLPTCY